MNQPILGVRGTAEYVKATGEGTPDSPYIPIVQVEGGGTGGGGTTTVDFGTQITDATMPAGGGGILGWVSAIWKTITDRLPSPINNRLPVDVTNQISFGTQITDATMPAGGGGILGWLSAISRALSNGTGFASTATIQRPSGATAYTANDVYGSIIELSNVGSSGGNVFINNIKIMFNTSTPPSGMTSLVIYLYSASPPSAIADNLVFNGASADRDFHLTEDGITLSVATMRGGGSFFAMASNINRQVKLAANSTSLWAYVVTPNAFTPTSSAETGTITINSFVA
jgi:hypothetical protein